jgi:hypothetical protein
VVTERHRHRYEANEKYLERLQKAGLVISAITQREKLTEMIELPVRGAPLVRRRAVPPRVQVHPLGRPPAVHRVHRRGTEASGCRQGDRKGNGMNLCGFEVGLDRPFFLIAGTCSIEGLEMSLDVAGQLKETCTALGIPLIYKGSFDKANRSSGNSQRGVGIDAGLKILDEVRRQTGLPVITDVHDEAQVADVASVVDVLQTPAFLCRQTDFIRAVAMSGRPVNIKKGQFLAPWDMKNVIDKARAAAKEAGLSEDRFMACERGVSFGYNNLVADMTQPGRYAQVRRAGGVRRHPLGAEAWRPGQREWRCPRDGAGAGACRQSPWAWRACSWKPTPTRPRPESTAPMPCR